MRVVKRAQLDAQFPLPTGTADSANVEKLVRETLTNQKEVSRVWSYREAEEDTSPRQFVVRPEP